MNTTILTLASILLIVLACEAPPATEPKANESDTPPEKTQQVTKEAPEENWTYEEDSDEMTGEVTKYAASVATNQLEFDFPYDGGSDMSLILKQEGGKNDAALQISPGQFVGAGTSSQLRIKFDDDEVEYYEYLGTESGSSEVIFLDNSTQFIKKLLASKKVMIEAPFYQDGRKIAYFETEGLKWEL